MWLKTEKIPGDAAFPKEERADRSERHLPQADAFCIAAEGYEKRIRKGSTFYGKERMAERRYRKGIQIL